MASQILTTNKADTGERKTLLPEEEATSMELMTLLNFEGVLQHSPMFYGYYSNRQSSDTGYRLPTAYFITGLVVYIYSFVATLRKYILYYLDIWSTITVVLMCINYYCLFVVSIIAQNGRELPSEQTVRKRRRVHFYVETLHRVGLHDRKRRDRPQSYIVDYTRF